MAYLLTDTGVYGPDGRIAEFRRKPIEFSIGGQPCVAVATAGPSLAGEFLQPYGATLRPATIHEFLSAFPQVFRDVEQKLAARGVKRGFSAVLAIYAHERRRPVGYGMSSVLNFFPQLYALQPIRKHLTEYAGEPFPRGTDVCDPRQWNPDMDARALIEAQRADLYGEPGAQFYAVGGQAILTRVDAEGIRHQVLQTWPDRIGRKIDPARKVGWRDRLTPPWLKPGGMRVPAPVTQ